MRPHWYATSTRGLTFEPFRPGYNILNCVGVAVVSILQWRSAASLARGSFAVVFSLLFAAGANDLDAEGFSLLAPDWAALPLGLVPVCDRLRLARPAPLGVVIEGVNVWGVGPTAGGRIVVGKKIILA